MERYEHILFDLDGTLTDPALGITNSVMYALRAFGIEVEERSSLFKFIGPPLLDSFRDFYGFDNAKSHEALEKYREYFGPKGIFENEVYEGIVPLLEGLVSSGRKLYLATSKPELYAVQILEHFGLKKFFTFCGGSDMQETRVKKGEVIHYVLESAGLLACKEKCLMVGDREHDIFGAKENGLDSLGVLYGYGSREELLKAGATYLAAGVCDVAAFC